MLIKLVHLSRSPLGTVWCVISLPLYWRIIFHSNHLDRFEFHFFLKQFNIISSTFCYSFILSYWLHMSFEAPMIGLIKLMLDHSRPKNRQRNDSKMIDFNSIDTNGTNGNTEANFDQLTPID